MNIELKIILSIKLSFVCKRSGLHVTKYARVLISTVHIYNTCARTCDTSKGTFCGNELFQEMDENIIEKSKQNNKNF